ncbi:hypothetical protein SI65_04498 [Aspergillus cristatus]|uniref:Protein kinase domain-containing protein n=1 Tax=Aspergillus cristatus TaxID=573508 RepID=A0A1E3BEY1_ASPCR|nr:hypothetical protein SI65_04498 [Aspergillus cristatus]
MLHIDYILSGKDFKSDNFLIAFKDPATLENYIRDQETNPPPYKMSAGRPIFESRPDFGPLKKGVGQVKISDFSTAVFGNGPVPHSHDIQPQQFCAPEVLLKATWSYSADIWNLGLVLWELLAETTVFNGRTRGSDEYSQAVHLAQMIRLLGPPPLQFLKKTDRSICSVIFRRRNLQIPRLDPLRGVQLA